MDERIERILRHPASVPTAVGLVAFAGGVGLGYILWHRAEERILATVEQLEFDFEEDKTMSVEEIREQVKGFLTDGDGSELEEEPEIEITFRQERPDPADIQVDQTVLAHIEKIVANGGTPTAEDYQLRNVFASSSTDDWDYDIEVEKRTEDGIYVIHKDEFYAAEMGWDQSTLTYYAGDDILVDELESPVPNFKQVVGEGNLKFGHGSDDPNSVHIRNHPWMSEYEIIRDEGAYAEEVLGIIADEEYDPDNLQHSLRKARARRRKEREE